MVEKNDGGPAFPRTAADPDWGGGTESFEGMSLRDYFAAKAVVGIWSNESWVHVLITKAENKGLSTARGIAKCAYELADAMLEERRET